jgi:hypothetical protein
VPTELIWRLDVLAMFTYSVSMVRRGDIEPKPQLRDRRSATLGTIVAGNVEMRFQCHGCGRDEVVQSQAFKDFPGHPATTSIYTFVNKLHCMQCGSRDVELTSVPR